MIVERLKCFERSNGLDIALRKIPIFVYFIEDEHVTN